MIISTRAVIKLPSVNCTFHRNKPPRKKRLPLKSKSLIPLIRNKRLTSRSKQDFSVERKTDIVWWWTLLWTHRNKPPRKKRLPLKSKSRKPLIRNKRLTSRSKQDFSIERKTDIVWWWTLLWTHLWDDFHTHDIETSSPPSHDHWWTQKSDEHFHQHSNSHSDSGHDQHFHQHSNTHSDSGHNASSSHDLSDFT